MRPKLVRKLFWCLLAAGAVLGVIGAYCAAALALCGMALMLCAVLMYAALYRCPHCGRYLDRSTGEFCPHCGEKLDP